MENIISKFGLALDFVGCILLFIETIAASTQVNEDYIQTNRSLWCKKWVFQKLPQRAFALLGVGFLLQLFNKQISQIICYIN